MTTGDHLSDEVLVRAIDDELLECESAALESHLLQCGQCKRRRHELGVLSSGIETLIKRIPVTVSADVRESLKRKLEPQHVCTATERRVRRALWRFGWGLAIAVALAVAVLFAPRNRPVASPIQPPAAQLQIPATFEIAGETFVALPYSNADLPLNPAHIVQMRVPLASLAAAGVSFAPVSSSAAPADDSVVAEVLLGIDGQPRGVHLPVLNR